MKNHRNSVPGCIEGYSGDASELDALEIYAIWFSEDDTFFCMDDFIFTTVIGGEELLESVRIRGMVGGQVRRISGEELLREALRRECLGIQVFFSPSDIRRYLV